MNLDACPSSATIKLSPWCGWTQALLQPAAAPAKLQPRTTNCQLLQDQRSTSHRSNIWPVNNKPNGHRVGAPCCCPPAMLVCPAATIPFDLAVSTNTLQVSASECEATDNSVMEEEAKNRVSNICLMSFLESGLQIPSFPRLFQHTELEHTPSWQPLPTGY